MAAKQTLISFDAKPFAFEFELNRTALLVIDMQRDFLCEGGFGEIQGGNLSAVQASVAPTLKLLEACRAVGMQIFHTREGHVPDLADLPSSKLIRQASAPNNSQHMKVIGDEGSLGRLLIRGSYGQDIVESLQPLPNEIVVDKPGKGAFWNTDILHKLKARGITHLLVSGVTTECCFATSIREANDRGLECCGIVEATAGYNPAFKDASLDMIYWSQGLFGFVGHLEPLLEALLPHRSLEISTDTPPQTPGEWNGNLDISELQAAYRLGLSPIVVAETVCDRIEKYTKVDTGVWIHLASRDSIVAAARDLMIKYPNRDRLPPLFGVPFNVKDSIDVAGVPTTVACPPLSRVASKSAKVVELVCEQGGLFIGKTNLDQLATGLSGCRSPYGVPHSVYSDKYISGGSSSGSCVSIGAQLSTFSLATDTAGSGRVPAGFNGVVGYKPTRGLISFEGVTPACLSLDCIAITARNITDARTVWQVCEQFDSNDRYARDSFPAPKHINSVGPQSQAFSFAIPPPEALSICSDQYRDLFNKTVQQLQSAGGSLKPVDYTPFAAAERLLYAGTFVSERLASLPDDFMSLNRDKLHPVIVELMDEVSARGSTAVQAYRDLQNKALFTRQAGSQFTSAAKDGFDILVVPTAPFHPTIKDMLADPVKLNSKLGTFTHFGNVLDLCGVAVPVSTYLNSEGIELPFSITLLSRGCLDAELLQIAKRLEDTFSSVVS